jgi:hypothetical protein
LIQPPPVLVISHSDQLCERTGNSGYGIAGQWTRACQYSTHLPPAWAPECHLVCHAVPRHTEWRRILLRCHQSRSSLPQCETTERPLRGAVCLRTYPVKGSLSAPVSSGVYFKPLPRHVALFAGVLGEPLNVLVGFLAGCCADGLDFANRKSVKLKCLSVGFNHLGFLLARHWGSGEIPTLAFRFNTHARFGTGSPPSRLSALPVS